METSTPLNGRRSWKKVVLITLAVLVSGAGIAAATTAWWVKRNIYAAPMQPTQLTVAEQKTLDGKLQLLESPAKLEAAPGEEHRTLLISQKEINAYLAAQGLGEQVRVELDKDAVAAVVNVPVPADSGLPLISGTTLRLRVLLGAAMDVEKRVVLQIRDVRLGGISLPNAWLAELKGVNLMAQDVETDPLVQRFLAGIKELEIRPEGLRVLLHE